MMKLVLAMMCVSLSVGALAGCSTSTMPAPNDPSTAIHEEPVASGGPQQTNGTTVAAAPGSHKMLMESTTAAK